MRKILHSLALAIVAIAGASAQAPADAIAGRFSVSDGKQVYFAKGNLQYTQSTQTWSFAEHQYDMIGEAKVSNGALADKIDMFGWSGSTGSAKWGISTSQSYSDYSGDFVDWGTNIGDGSTWYTLDVAEWAYLLKYRTNAKNLMGVARINLNADGSQYANGLVLLPDSWVCPAGVTFKSGFANKEGVQAYANYQILTLSDWQKLESSGAVFLPASSLRIGADVIDIQSNGYYWSATPNGASYANYQYTTSRQADTGCNNNRYVGHTVRLVKNCATEEEAESAYVAKPFTVAEGKQITFAKGNLQYTQSTQTWAFAEQQYDMLGTDNVDGGTEQTDTNFGYYYKDGTALADKIDLFGWSGSTGSAKWGVSTSTNKTDYSGDFVDWGKNTIGTDIPDTWRTLTKDEWGYLLSGRTNAYNLVGGARINLNADGSKYVNGLVLLPDNWTCPAGVTFKSGLAGTYSVQAYADYQTFTFSDWQLLESAGAVFLPASGSRYGASVFSVQYYGFYWSATPAASDEAYYMSFSSYSCFSKYGKGSLYGYAVRLVKNYSNVSTDLSHPSAADTAPARKVLRNGTVLIERNGKTYTLTGTEVK